MSCLRELMLLVGTVIAEILAVTAMLGLFVLFAWGIWNYPVYTAAGILGLFLINYLQHEAGGLPSELTRASGRVDFRPLLRRTVKASRIL